MEPSATPGPQMGVPTEGRERSPEPPDYEDEFLRYLWRDYLYPKQYEWVLIAAYVAVFFVALVGNTLGRSLGLWECCGVPLGTGRGPGPHFSPQSLLGSVGKGLAAGARLDWAWLCLQPHFFPCSPCSVPGRVAQPPHEDRHQLLHRQPVPGRRAGDGHLPAG